ncbi:hypothetical protein DICPUDRAFT_92530 [Dictyostelium purpureum]|uniref:TM7S3/TM198-like domain-containing protein n=1 Tax=Dictyostelium purpureum TaxID=5786 RepID=F0ZTD9_DICPU|nr:uncharacterized protein DICPUDRAFT_92530 [Dictyostelium purpureum]EGC32799.1 hypothetical protein DICPUDRAFT_92530 [Dictyostelium purpureum]|eukprot:XP_003290687.1 hypothetical protein DICPUDRAFT_92530 [Dictyostelium purpureum]
MTPDEFVGMFCLIGGFGLCAFGSKYQEATLSFFGSGLGAYLFYLLSLRIEFSFTTQVALFVIVSLVFSFICMKFVRVSVLAIAIIHALCISNLMAPGLGNVWGSVVKYAALIILPSLFLYAPDIGILVSSSFFGSWIFVVGIEQFIGTGFPSPLLVLFNKNWDTLVEIEESAFLECLLVCSIMITSLIIQIRYVEASRERQLDLLLKEIEDAIEKKQNDKQYTLLDEEQVVGDETGSSINNSGFKIILDMVTPGGDEDYLKTDKKDYFVEKLVGHTESSKPLLK